MMRKPTGKIALVTGGSRRLPSGLRLIALAYNASLDKTDVVTRPIEAGAGKTLTIRP